VLDNGADGAEPANGASVMIHGEDVGALDVRVVAWGALVNGNSWGARMTGDVGGEVGRGVGGAVAGFAVGRTVGADVGALVGARVGGVVA
jgi:hypothetical protein